MKLNYKNILKPSLALFVGLLLVSSSCKKDNDNNDSDPEFPFTVPSTYDTSSAFSPAAWNGQATRRAQLNELVSYTKGQPISFDLVAALQDGSLYVNADANSSSTKIYNKIDENTVSSTVGDDFVDLADSLKNSSANSGTASNGTAGRLDGRNFSAKGLEYAQILEKGLFGACFYDQIVDDYLGTTQAADGPSNKSNSKADNETTIGKTYEDIGTKRQHAFDEAFGYLGAPLDWPTTPGEFLAKYITNVSNTNELSFDLDDKLAKAFRVGRAALKDGEGTLSGEDNTDETILTTQIDNIKKYIEYGIAGAAFSYLNDVIADTQNEDKLHHLSEALAFIYALSFNSDGTISSSEAYAVLEELDWSTDDLTGVYEVDLWSIINDLNNTKVKAAIAELATSFPELEDVNF